jgi:hypothetical protein
MRYIQKCLFIFETQTTFLEKKILLHEIDNDLVYFVEFEM